MLTIEANAGWHGKPGSDHVWSQEEIVNLLD
jgi:hypothetical protein